MMNPTFICLCLVAGLCLGASLDKPEQGGAAGEAVEGDAGIDADAVKLLESEEIEEVAKLTNSWLQQSSIPEKENKTECGFISDYFCNPTADDHLQRVDDKNVTTAEACNEKCLKEKNCTFFTYFKFRGFASCHLLRSCKEQKPRCTVPGTCVSGRKNCTETPKVRPTGVPCAKLKLTPGYNSHWRCDGVNPYKDDIPSQVTCHTSCPLWKNKAGKMVTAMSTCQYDGTWSETLALPPGPLAHPKKLEKPDGPDMKCDGCKPLNLTYNPNEETGAAFHCNPPINWDNLPAKIDGTAHCNLLCDNMLVASMDCHNLKWTGNPDLGFWCAEEKPPVNYWVESKANNKYSKTKAKNTKMEKKMDNINKDMDTDDDMDMDMDTDNKYSKTKDAEKKTYEKNKNTKMGKKMDNINKDMDTEDDMDMDMDTDNKYSKTKDTGKKTYEKKAGNETDKITDKGPKKDMYQDMEKNADNETYDEVKNSKTSKTKDTKGKNMDYKLNMDKDMGKTSNASKTAKTAKKDTDKKKKQEEEILDLLDKGLDGDKKKNKKKKVDIDMEDDIEDDTKKTSKNGKTTKTAKKKNKNTDKKSDKNKKQEKEILDEMDNEDEETNGNKSGTNTDKNKNSKTSKTKDKKLAIEGDEGEVKKSTSKKSKKPKNSDTLDNMDNELEDDIEEEKNMDKKKKDKKQTDKDITSKTSKSSKTTKTPKKSTKETDKKSQNKKKQEKIFDYMDNELEEDYPIKENKSTKKGKKMDNTNKDMDMDTDDDMDMDMDTDMDSEEDPSYSINLIHN